MQVKSEKNEMNININFQTYVVIQMISEYTNMKIIDTSNWLNKGRHWKADFYT